MIKGEGRFATIVLEPSSLALIRKGRSSGGRATLMTRVGSIVLACLAATSKPEVDARVVLPQDLRYLVGGLRVAGNFVSAESYGTLRTTDWSAGNLSRLLAARRGTGAVALLASTLRGMLSRGDQEPAGGPTISLSLMGAVALPTTAWRGAPRLACATIGPTAGTFIFVVQVGDTVTVSVWDDSERFDLDAFRASFHSEVQRRLVD